jgi:signal transduction histidine kinase
MNFLVSNSDSLSQTQIMQKIQDLEGVSTQINQELRDTIWATQHEQVPIQDFISRVKSFVFQTLGPESPIRVHYSENADEQLIFGPFVTLNLHRICQEALHNIVKHSDATDIYISFESRNHHFVVSIRDNGKGFDTGLTTSGYGLQNMHHRAKQVAANLVIDSKPGQGTRLEITVHKLTLADDKQ